MAGSWVDVLYARRPFFQGKAAPEPIPELVHARLVAFAVMAFVLFSTGLIRNGGKITDGFNNYRTDVYWHVPETIRQTLGLSDQADAEIINNVRPHNLSTFARAIAKIAYCTAVVKYGLDGFRPLVTPQIILGHYPHIPYWIGPVPDPHGPPAPRGQQHTVEFGTLNYQRLKLMFAAVRLFADSRAPQGGMPRYQVIFGVEGKRKIIPKRMLPNPRRPILL